MNALLYLTYRSFVNYLLSILRSPKRLIPVIVMVLLFVPGLIMAALMPLFGAYAPQSQRMIMGGLGIDAIWSAVFGLVVLIIVSSIHSALSDGALVFPQAHIDFLFPTPIERFNILVLKLVGDVAKATLYSAWMVIWIGPMVYRSIGIFPYPALLVAWPASVCLIVFVSNTTHTLNIVTHYGKGRALLASRLAKLCVIGLLVMIAVSFGLQYARGAHALPALVGAVAKGAARFIVLPATWMADVALAPAVGVKYYGLWELVWLWLLAAGSTILLLTRRENFYEPSLNASARAARIRAAIRRGGYAALRMEARQGKGRTRYETSPVPPFGRGAAALIWKDLVTSSRGSKGAVVLLFLIPIAAGLAGAFAPSHEVANLLLFLYVYMLWIFSLITYQQFVTELSRANIIKAMPVSGFGLVFAYVFNRWLQAVPVLVVAALSMRLFIPEINPGLLWTVAVGSCAAGLTGIATMTIPALLYPSSKDTMQRLIPTLVGGALVSLAMGPSAIVVVLALLFKVAWPIPSVALVALNAGLAWVAVAISGRLFRRFDPTSD